MQAIIVTQEFFNKAYSWGNDQIPSFFGIKAKHLPTRITEIMGLPLILDEEYCQQHNAQAVVANNYIRSVDTQRGVNEHEQL
jgi:hypothetical protein